jgi:hypothetical protein
MFCVFRVVVFSWPLTAVPALFAAALLLAPAPAAGQGTGARANLPRTADGKPDLGGIWQVRNTAASDLLDHAAKFQAPAGRAVVAGNEIPYQPWAAAKKAENFQNRATADPLSQCFLPGVPRIMYLDFPFQIFQTPQMIAMTFEWSSVHRQIYMDGSSHVDGIDFWMGDSRGRWEGDTLVVNVSNHNDKTWFDMAGNFHSEALRLVERYTLVDADTIQYEVTVEDPKVFTRPWKIGMAFHRHKAMDRILEYQCQAEAEEASGAFPREPATWYPEPGAPPSPAAGSLTAFNPQQAARPKPAANAAQIRRRPDGKPDLQGAYMSDGGGGNYGLERHAGTALTPGGRGLIVDPADGKLPMQTWARAENDNRKLPERGYDDPTAHCFVAGVPRSMYVPSPFHIVQTAGHVVFLFERMAWRIVPTDGRAHLPDRVRLWQGDSVGRWDGDTLVVETANLNGKTWLNEVGEIVSHAERVVERFTPLDADTIDYEATVTDPIVYTRPWTIAFAMKRQPDELLEVACHEDDQDLPRLKAIRDAARAGRK